jgi:VanZ family protein
VLPLSYPYRWRIAGVLLLALVLTLALLPSLWFWPRNLDDVLKFSDKWLHGVTFALLALWFSGQYSRRVYWKFAAGLLVFGALIEVCQYFLPYRRAEMTDMIADICGIVCGILIAMLGAGGWSMRFEQWLQTRIG